MSMRFKKPSHNQHGEHIHHPEKFLCVLGNPPRAPSGLLAGPLDQAVIFTVLYTWSQMAGPPFPVAAFSQCVF